MSKARQKTAVSQQLKKLGVDPVARLIGVAQDANCPLSVQAKIWCELLQYAQPKLKAVEITGKDGGPVQLDLFNWQSLVKQSGESSRE